MTYYIVHSYLQFASPKIYFIEKRNLDQCTREKRTYRKADVHSQINYPY